MNLDRLRAVQAEEREADSLRPLPDSFYREVVAYLEDLREQRSAAAEAAGDPFGDEDVRRLTDEIETAEEVVEAIYERRVGKLVKRASLAAAGMPADDDGLTNEEAELFGDLVAQIEDHREAVLASFDGNGGRTGEAGVDTSADSGDTPLADEPGGGPTAADPAPDLDASDAVGGVPDDPGPGAADPGSDAPPPPPDEPVVGDDGDHEPGSDGDEEPAGSAESTDGGQHAAAAERVTVRITRDVGEVFGVDERVYDLTSEDVVTLPAANAKPLLDRDAAEEID